MKFLDQQIEVSVTLDESLQINTSYQYNIIETIGNVDDIIFIGTTWLTSHDKTFDITDIVRSRYLSVKPQEGQYETNKLREYSVAIVTNGETYYSDSVEVLQVYRYPHILKSMNPELKDTSILLQGNNNSKYTLLPEYPFISTPNYLVGLSSLNNSGRKLLLSVTGKQFSTPITFNINSNSSSNNVFTTLEGLLSDLQDCLDTSIYGVTYINNEYYLNTNTNPPTYQTQSYLTNELLTTDTPHFAIWVEGNYEPLASVDISGSEEYPETYDLTFVLDNETIQTLKGGGKLFCGIVPYVPLDDYSYQSEYCIEIDILNQELDSLVDKEITMNVGTYYYVGDGFPVETTQDPAVYEFIINSLTTNKCGAGNNYYLVKDGVDKFAKLSECNKGYYLLWEDRYGSYQSQKFDKVSTFKEDIERSTYNTYTGEKVYNSISVTPTFTINSNWIQSELYPYYESIFVSPYLLLYDIENDESYYVNITDSEFIEKTNSNQEGFFNLTLNLTSSKQQTKKL